ncbi:flavodoxin [candidate division KSB1 bacterium]|nr:flavodoxin [candidate division KSB1 bacterium]
MKTLIVYATSHGCTEQCAEKVRTGLNGEVEFVNLKHNPKIDPASYDTVIVGGSIHAGRIQGRVKKFCTAHENVLLTNKLGLFICCMEEERAQEEFDNNYSDTLRDHATAKGIFGGAFDFEKMNFIAKAIVKKVGGVTESVNKISVESIDKFIKEIK